MVSYAGDFLPAPEDMRAARSYLGWSQKDLGKKLHLTAAAIAHIENKKHRTSTEKLIKIKDIFWEAGIEFLPLGGFRPRRDLVSILEGPDCYLALLDDVYHTLRPVKGEVLYIGADERKSGPDIIESKRRLLKADVKSRYLIEQGNYYILGELKDYRWLKKEVFTVNDVTLIYDSKTAFVTISDEIKRIVILKDRHIAQNQRRIFEFFWRSGIQPDRTVASDAY
jgi:transcriptional regulator with XRE-family HTH domain